MLTLIDNKTRAGNLLLLVFAIGYLKAGFDVPIDTTFGDETVNSRTLPIFLALATIACALLQLILPLLGLKPEALDTENSNERFLVNLKTANWRQVLNLLLLMFVYALSFEYLGFFLGGVCFLFCGFLLLGEKQYRVAALLSIGLVGSMWLALTQLFGLFLDSGELIRVIGGWWPW